MNTKICIPIMGKNKNEIIEQVKKVTNKKPDVIEWRADYCETLDQSTIKNIIDEIKEITDKKTELIFTFRTANEGGERQPEWENYCKYCIDAAKAGADYVDIEAYKSANEEKKSVERENADIGTTIEQLISGVKKYCKVIGSNHHFDETPSDETIDKIMYTMESLGADMCKLAVMPEEKEDVERFMESSKRLSKNISVPVITMSMGEMGEVTRVCTRQTGSAFTFAAGVDASAPGQMDADVVRYLLKINEWCSLKGNIALIGFMGTGKTTISKALSKITGFEETDVDAYIVEQQKKSISDIFKDSGEEYFRQVETNALREISKREGQIISCGGGAVLKDENVQILKERGVIVLLTATPETIFDRVKDHTHRPILNSDMSLKHVKELMAAREPRYQSVADIKVNVDSNDRTLTCYNIIKNLEISGNITYNK